METENGGEMEKGTPQIDLLYINGNCKLSELNPEVSDTDLGRRGTEEFVVKLYCW